MTTLNKYSLAFVATSLLFLGACKKEDPVIPNEEELITTLIFTLTPDTGGGAIQMTFRDLDGDGGNAPVITGGALSANTNYSGTLQLLNETEVPAGDITDEINAEKESHQFFYSIGGGLDLAIGYDDLDGSGKPVGLSITALAGYVSSGQLTIILRHEPDKNAAGVSNGDITNAGGETDIEVTFDVTIQ